MPTADCRSRPQAPANITAPPRRRDLLGLPAVSYESGARFPSRRNRFVSATFLNGRFAASRLKAVDVDPAARSAAPRRYAEGRRIRPPADRLWARIQSALGLLPGRFRRMLDL